MSACTQSLRVRKNRFGRGVYAKRDYARGEIIEVSPAVIVKKRDIRDDDRLADYAFEWARGKYAIALGYGSLFNHSEEHQNATWRNDLAHNRLIFYAIRPIKRGQEIFTNYGYDPARR